MEATVNILCYKSKTLKNGEHPIVLRVCKDNSKRYISLGISVKEENWDFSKNQPTKKCPKRKEILEIMRKTRIEYEEKLRKVKLGVKPYTAKSLIDYQLINSLNVGDFIQFQIKQLEKEGRRGYMLSVKQLYNSLIKYNKHLEIYFENIDFQWLHEYEIWLRRSGLAENTIGIRFRTLRGLYNMAIDRGITNQDSYPFRRFSVGKLHQETLKRSISKKEVNKIANYHPKNDYQRLAIDIFTFTYYEGGINFVDIAYLTSNNIVDNLLVYTRQKTNKIIKVPLQKQGIDIINRQPQNNSPYLFPILSKFHKTEIQKANRIHKVITKVNRELKEIGKELNISLKITTYVARHSQATVMKKAGVPTSVISQIMGHSSERVTQIYLDSFDNEQIATAMLKL